MSRLRQTQGHPSRRAAFAWAQRLYLLILFTCLLVAVAKWASDDAQAQTETRQALLLTVNDAITPATLDYLQRGIMRGEANAAEVLIIVLDTPGGLMASTRELIKSILSSSVPVVTYVSPPGARAASAGTYILLASHLAAMAPATHMGSATPVQIGGLPALPSEDPRKNRSPPDANAPETTPPLGDTSAMERKLIEDAVSYIRELADRHGRNADWAESAVRNAANLGAREALAENVIDLIATDTGDLLRQIHGRTVTLATGARLLDTRGVHLLRLEPDWRTRLLSVITDPNIAYFLLLLGFYGIIFEFANPGGLLPGVIGATCLLLALFAFQILSVNYAGLALIILGLAFILAEAFVPSFGVLGIGGVIAFIAGSVILMDGSHQAVSLPAVGGVGAIAAGFLLWAVSRLVSLRRRLPVSGAEHLSEEMACAMETFAYQDGRYRGHIHMHGERWRAVSDAPVKNGEALEILAVDGLTVHVAKAASG